MPDTIALAPTARSKCRGCGRTIEKGALRFGEAEANPFGEGETQRWFHLDCAALRRPERFGPALEATPDMADRERLAAFVHASLEHPRLVRIAGAERAPSGRAHCRHCREIIDKGALRVALEIWEDGRFSPMGSLHVTCAPSYFGTRELVPRIEHASPDLPETDVARIREIVATTPEVAAVAAPGSPGGEPNGGEENSSPK
jgi:Poly(ADP-ribose) polymerase and DNA-Ligase Zn-finger region